MPDNSSEKKGLFSWFSKKDKTNQTIPQNPTKPFDEAKPQVEAKSQDEDVGQQSPCVKSADLSAADSKFLQNEVEANLATATMLVSDEQKQANERSKEESVLEEPTQKSFFQRLKQGLSKTRNQFSGGLANLVLGQKEIDDELLEEVETLLLLADVGVDTTTKIIKDLTEKSLRKELKDTQALKLRLKQLLLEIIEPVQIPLVVPKQDTPFVILMVGVNGVGKTTTIGKMAHQFIAQGKTVMLAAGDTFRAAAVEQLKTWGERNQVPVIAQHTGADSASVIFDAVEAAKARKIDIVIADTAGRLHNKAHLMEELNKVKRVMGKIDINAPHEVMLVVDAGTGQNALVQAVEFNKVVALNSVTISKLDGTAKGGVVFALADKMKLPIRYIGVGETKQDLRIFNANDFIEALFDQ